MPQCFALRWSDAVQGNWRISNASERDKKIYEACAEYAENGEDEETARKARDFLALLEEMRRKVPYTPIHELLTEILERTGYSGYAAALPGREQRKANLQMLMKKRWISNPPVTGDCFILYAISSSFRSMRWISVR